MRLEDIAEKVAMGPFGSSIKVETFKPAGIPIISGQHLHEAELKDGDNNFISTQHADALKNANVRRGDVVFTHAGNIGQVAFIPEDSVYDRYVISQRQFYLRCNTNLILPEFVTYYFKSPEGRHRLLANATQVGVPSIARPSSYLKSIEVPVPPLDEQRVIVRNIRGLDAKIRINRRINQTLEAMAQAIFKSWFVDFDPVKAKIAAKAEGRDPLRAAMCAISGKTHAELDALPPEQLSQLAATAGLFADEMEESELGEIPKGWMSSTLGELCRTQGGLIQTGPFGSQLHAHDYTTEGIPVVMPQDLSGRRISIDKIARIDESDAKRLHRHRLQAGDIVFSRRGDVGRHALVTPREVGWLCGTGCLLVRPSTEAKISAYVSCALAQAESLEWLTRHAVGATMPNLNTTILSNLPIVLPPSAVLTGLQDRLDAMEAAMNLCVGQIETLSELRDALLPKLLSGELSVSTREAEAVA